MASEPSRDAKRPPASSGGAYEHLGLFWNPFGEVPARDWPDLIETALALAELAARLRGGGVALVFRGEAGRGKSTHLRALHRRFFADLPYTYLGPDASPRTPIPVAPVCFVDEAQRLGRGPRRRLFRRAPALALTSHADLDAELESRFEVIEHRIAGLERARLATIVARRVGWAARPGGALVEVADARLDELIAEHGDDLRSIQDALYDEFEALRRDRRR